ncbi:MAG: N-acetyl-gamma-glutamyl-phosphate reductase [Pantoea sp. Brub]|nr:N-acetyl-gamma-glutamyl-phosphate reductase [Pantoea sp. Brub]
MLKTLIIGASGYTGVELITLLHKHPNINIIALLISEDSLNIGKKLSDIYPQLKHIIDLPLQKIDNDVSRWKSKIDVVFLATSHEVSYILAPKFINIGCIVFDLSGAFRINNANIYEKFYNFKHDNTALLNKAVYGLAEFYFNSIKNAQLIAIPGCYPTVALLSLKPLMDSNLLDLSHYPIINAISGVSGSGRKASINTHFCEISLKPYGIFNHRHYPEIVSYLGCQVIFIPHIGNFSRGILATIVCHLKTGITKKIVQKTFLNYYQNKPLIRLYTQGFPSLNSVIKLPYCDIGFEIKKNNLIIIATEDNLLKGSSSQAIQCLNIRFGLPEGLSLINYHVN